MTLRSGDDRAVEDQARKREECYRDSQDQRRNAIHTPYVQNVRFNVCEVESVGKSYTRKVDREHYTA